MIIFLISIQVDFDKTKHLADSTIKKRQQEREKLIEKEREKEEKERMYGTKYSVLVKLPYFHFINMCIIDPMHNLFLGTAKKMNKIQIWKEEGILTKENVVQVQQRVDKTCCSNDV